MSIPKLVFIVPYRNRKQEKLHFSVYMRYILEDYNINDYEIYYSHQIDKKPFCRGGVKNIGFLAIKDKYPNDYKNITFVFNDVDTLPTEKNMLDYATTKGIVKHFFGFTFTLGGIFSIIGEDFETCNGFPNLYGWGLEDNAMHDRVVSNNIKISRDIFFNIGSRDIINLPSDTQRLIYNKDPGDYKKKQFFDNLNSIKKNNLDYNIEANKENIINNSNREFIINIISFTTLISPRVSEFYTQDLSQDKNLHTNVLEKRRSRSAWSMTRFIG